MREETGLEVAVERLVGIYGKADRDDLVFSFACRIVGGHLTTTDESDECRYFEIEQIPFNTSPREVETLQEAVKSGSQPVFRRHTAPSTREWLRQWEDRTPAQPAVPAENGRRTTGG